MTTPTQISEFCSTASGKAVEMFGLCAEVNQKILRELVDLSASTAKEGMRLYAELQSSALDAMKEGQQFLLHRQADLSEAPTDPFAFYQKAVLDSAEGTQKTFKNIEGGAQAITRSAERLQVTAEQTSKEIQGALAQLMGQVKSLYAPLG